MNNLYPPTTNFYNMTSDVKYISNHDGDIVKLSLTREIDVRLIGVDTHEPRGVFYKDFLAKLLQNSDLKLVIPTNGNSLLDINSFNRVLGWLMLGEYSVNDIIQDIIEMDNHLWVIEYFPDFIIYRLGDIGLSVDKDDVFENSLYIGSAIVGHNLNIKRIKEIVLKEISNESK